MEILIRTFQIKKKKIVIYTISLLIKQKKKIEQFFFLIKCRPIRKKLPLNPCFRPAYGYVTNLIDPININATVGFSIKTKNFVIFGLFMFQHKEK